MQLREEEQVRTRERRRNNTQQCREALGKKEAKCKRRTTPSETSQEQRNRGKTYAEELKSAKWSDLDQEKKMARAKKYQLQSSQLLLDISAWRLHKEVSLGCVSSRNPNLKNTRKTDFAFLFYTDRSKISQIMVRQRNRRIHCQGNSQWRTECYM